jgi:sporulation protein YlmC with PRC-barrel domain
MLRGISDLKRFTVATTEGIIGSVGDVYFDDRSWSVRYLVVNANTWLPGRRVLIAPSAVRSSEPPTLHVALSKEQVAASRDVNTRGVPGSSTREGVKPANLARARENGDAYLQTATTVMGYAIRTEDGEIGHVEDLLVDDQAWAIRYLVVDTENQWVGRKVLVSPAWLINVAWGGVEDALLYRHGGRQRYRERGQGSDSADRASADCCTSIPLFERARAALALGQEGGPL